MRFLLLPLIVYPLLELWVLFKVGAAIGALATLALVIASGIAGAAILRRVGLHTLSRVNLRLYRGEAPAKELFEGFTLALAGLLLFLPGLIGDVIGLFCLLPTVRRWLFEHAGTRAAAYAGHGDPLRQPHRSHEGPVTIDGEYRRED